MKAPFLTTILCLAALFNNAPAGATCAQSNLTGTWYFYINLVDEWGEGDYYWGRCAMVIKSGGNFNTSSSSCIDSDNQRFRLSSGSLRVTSDCRVTGSIKVVGESTTNTIVDAQLNRSKDVIAGVGKNSVDHDLFNFTAIKK